MLTPSDKNNPLFMYSSEILELYSTFQLYLTINMCYFIVLIRLLVSRINVFSTSFAKILYTREPFCMASSPNSITR